MSVADKQSDILIQLHGFLDVAVASPLVYLGVLMDMVVVRGKEWEMKVPLSLRLRLRPRGEVKGNPRYPERKRRVTCSILFTRVTLYTTISHPVQANLYIIVYKVHVGGLAHFPEAVC